MIKFRNILNEEKSNIEKQKEDNKDFAVNNKKKKKFVEKLFKDSNTGKIKASGLKKIINQIEKNDLRYYDFPQWVLETWIDASKLPAIPLKNNRYLNSQVMVSNEDNIEVDDIIYSGWVVDASKKQEFGTKALTISKSHEIDFDKYQKLLLYKKTAIQALRVIERKKKNQESGLTDEGFNGLNNNAENGTTENNFGFDEEENANNNNTTENPNAEEDGFVDLK
jgi:hypothetical protein